MWDSHFRSGVSFLKAFVAVRAPNLAFKQAMPLMMRTATRNKR